MGKSVRRPSIRKLPIIRPGAFSSHADYACCLEYGCLGLCVSHFASHDHVDELLEGNLDDVEKLVLVEVFLAFSEATRKIEPDDLRRVCNRRIELPDLRPFVGFIARLLPQFPLCSFEMVLVFAVELSRRYFDDYLSEGIAELMLGNDRAVVKKRNDCDCAVVAYELACALFPLGRMISSL